MNGMNAMMMMWEQFCLSICGHQSTLFQLTPLYADAVVFQIDLNVGMLFRIANSDDIAPGYGCERVALVRAGFCKVGHVLRGDAITHV